MSETTEQKNPPRVKMDIKDLKYIVMEGGGARGATYLGAIRELENQLAERVRLNAASEKKAHIEEPKDLKELPRIHGVMDFLSVIKEAEGNNLEETKPIIEGVAGASAGAITTFALVLGLNSEEIDTVLHYSFKEFLSEVDAGKYRMIDENSQLSVGEDDKIDKAIEHVSWRFRKSKGLGLKNDPFVYDLKKNATKINGNARKYVMRELTLSTIFKIALDGAAYNLLNVLKLFSGKSENNWFQKVFKPLLGFENVEGSIAKQTATAFAAKAFYTRAFTGGLYAFFNMKSGDIKVSGNSIAGIFKDRGMFSGFKVREFFFDLMIFAATKDTYFQKRLIAFFNDPANKSKYASYSDLERIFQLNLEQKDFKCKNGSVFQIGKRSEYKYDEKFTRLLDHLQHMTFREFYNIMGGVEYAAAVSNFTTNSPLYFSDKYTPHARVLEAVAASMSIPPAIRPLYNASDVLMESRLVTPGSQLITAERIQLINKGKRGMKKLDVYVNGEPREFVRIEGNKLVFTKSDYELYEYAFKKGFQQYLENRKAGTRVYIDTNNLIEMNTYMDEMQKLLIGIRPGDSRETVGEWSDQDVIVDGDKYKIKLDLMMFFYNAQFKGLLLDGGYFTNIPFNFFREKGDEHNIDGVLALKLDGDFPPNYLNSLNQTISKLKVKVDDIMRQIDRDEFEESFSVAGKRLKLPSDEMIDLQPIYQAIRLHFNKEIVYKEVFTKTKKQIKLQEENVRNIVKAWYKYYGAHNNLKPWEIPRPILDVAFTGYSFGAKRGQIRKISDHNHIIPLYDYGIGTYDFDMGKIQSLIDIAQHKAQEAVKKFFKSQEQANPPSENP